MSQYYQCIAKKASIIVILILFLFGAFPARAMVPSDPDYPQQAALWQQINAPAAWDRTIGSPRVVVAIIDSGADTWHEDLEQNIWTNPKEIAGNDVDDDHNGYVDDVHGWNFVENNNDVRTSVLTPDNSDAGSVDHGTLLAGLIGAAGNDGLDGVGLNWRVSIMPLRAINNDGTGSYTDVARAVDYAVNNGASVISMSFVGNVSDPVLRQSLLRAYKKGVVVVAAAGNHDGQTSGDLKTHPAFPACFTDNGAGNSQWMLTVGSVDSHDQISRFSNYGSCVSLVAPGENIYSTERYAPQFGYNNTFGGPWQGTSFATPLVAGAAALIKSLHPSFTAAQIIPLLLSSADSIAAHNPTLSAVDWGAGRLNVGQALTAAAVMDPTVPIDGVLYFHDAHSVSSINLLSQSQHAVLSLSDATIVAVAADPWPSSDLSDAVALLIQRGNYFYIHIITTAGALLKEFPLPVHPSAQVSIKKIRLLPDQSGGLGLSVLEQYDKRSDKTTFSEFDSTGTRIEQISLAGSVLDWQVDASSGSVITAQLKNKKLTIEEIPLGGGVPVVFTRTNILSASPLAVGSFLGGFVDSVQAALAVQTSAGWQQLIVDVQSGTFRTDQIAAPPKGMQWFLATVQPAGSITQALLRFSPLGGAMPVVDGRANTVATLLLHAFKGTID